MQFKLVPEPPTDLAFVGEVQDAVPLVPGDEDDCCARIMRRTDVSPRDEARTWLTFLRALELATESPSGFTRTRRDPEPDHLRRAFRERVYGAETVLEILAEVDEPLALDAVFARFESEIPHYERRKYGARLEEVWRERVRRLLEWGVRLDLAERDDGEYRPASAPRSGR